VTRPQIDYSLCLSLPLSTLSPSPPSSPFLPPFLPRSLIFSLLSFSFPPPSSVPARFVSAWSDPDHLAKDRLRPRRVQHLLQHHAPLVLGRRVAEEVEKQDVAKLEPCRRQRRGVVRHIARVVSNFTHSAELDGPIIQGPVECYADPLGPKSGAEGQCRNYLVQILGRPPFLVKPLSAGLGKGEMHGRLEWPE
jgi:hypothetical protein